MNINLFSKKKYPLIEMAVVLLTAFIWNQGVYFGARWIASGWYHYDMTTTFDLLVPFLPWTICIYFGCYLFWGVNYFLCAVQEKESRDRFFCADILAKGLCFVLFLAVPATNVRPDVVGDSVWDVLMRFLYNIDSADNLFPSIHCLASWLCWVGVRKRKDIPGAYRWFSFAAAVAVCVSTLTTRQHVFADVFSGILIAEACYCIAGFASVRKYYSAFVACTAAFVQEKILPTLSSRNASRSTGPEGSAE